MEAAFTSEDFPSNSEYILGLHLPLGGVITNTKFITFPGKTAVVNNNLSYSIHTSDDTFIVNMNIGGRLFRIIHDRHGVFSIANELRPLKRHEYIPNVLGPKDSNGRYYHEDPCNIGIIIDVLKEFVSINVDKK